MSERKRVDIKAILANPVLREEIVEGATDFICKVEGIRPHSFSPAAQAVLDACDQAFDQCGTTTQGLAAALRAVADQVAPETAESEQDDPEMLKGIWSERRTVRAELFAIAAELEGSND